MNNINNCNITIINYSDITKLRDDKELFLKISEADVHICASLMTSIAMNFEYGKELKSNIVISAGKLIGEITESWDDNDTKLIQTLKLNKEIKLLEEAAVLNNDIKYKELISIIKGNREDILSSIRLLVECNVYPEDIEESIENITDEIKVFLDIWKRLELVDEEILKFRNKIYNLLEDENKLKYEIINSINTSKEKQIQVLKEYFEEKQNVDYFIHKNYELNNKESNLKTEVNNLNNNIKYIKTLINDKYVVSKLDKEIKTIVFQGFYFITPIQDRIMELIIKKFNNVQVIFLNNYDKNNKDLFEIWDKSFSNKFYPIKDVKYMGNIKVKYKWSDVFAQIYNGESDNIGQIIRNIDNEVKQLSIKEYTNMITFQNDNNFENIAINTDNIYYSPESEQLNSILDDIYPRKSKKHILSRPIGHLIRNIHNIWNKSESSDLSIDIDMLESCFATGWLTIMYQCEEENASSYIHVLRKIREYFKDCKTLSEWKDRYSLWKDARNYIENNIGIKYILWNFSFFDVDEKDIEKIILFIEQIYKFVDILKDDKELSSDNETSISSHFENIKVLIDNILKSTKSEIKEEEDIKVIESLIKVLKNKQSDTTCLSDDIIDALSEYLNEENTQYEELDERILNIKDIDASSILNKYRKVNLCQITSDFIPGIKTRYTWPLSENLITNLIKTIGEEDECLELRLSRLKLIIEENTSRNKYLLFNALESSNDISISLIKNINNEEHRECIYMTLLRNEAKLKVENDNNMEFDFYNNKIDLIDNYLSYATNKTYFENKVNKNTNERRKEFINKNIEVQLHRILKHCPKRYSYNNIKDKDNKMLGISYTDDFHHRMLFSRLVQIIHDYCVRDNSISRNLGINNMHEVKDNESKKIENFNKLAEHLNKYFPQWTDIEKNSIIKDSIKYTRGNFYYNDDIIMYIKDIKTKYKVNIPIIIPSPNAIHCDNIGSNYNEDINYSIKVSKVSYNGKSKEIFNATEVDESTCTWCNCRELCKEGVYSVDLKNQL